jgi:hypothetical protein
VGRIVSSLAAALAVSACVSTGDNQTRSSTSNLSSAYLDRYAQPSPTPASFTECHGFSCSVVSHVSLSPRQWRRVRAVFRPRAADAAAERRQIARAIAVMQRLVGAQTGTGVHQWTHKNKWIIPNLGDPTQLDCIDEAVNTWTYMTMMERDHMFRFHRVAELAYAGLPTDPNPRNAAVIQEKKTGAYYVIDPSLVNFAVPPPVMPLKIWAGSWPPKISVDKKQVPPTG